MAGSGEDGPDYGSTLGTWPPAGHELPYCHVCDERQWRFKAEYVGGYDAVAVYRCDICNEIGVAIGHADHHHLDFAGGFDV